MFLSQLQLNLRHRRARHDLAWPYEMHRTVWSAFPEDGPGRILFRVDSDRLGARPVLLVQSDLWPRWQQLEEREPAYLRCPADVKEVDIRFTPGQRLRFRLRANPTRKTATLQRAERLTGAREQDERTKNGRRLALLQEDEQIDWLRHKAEQGGFRIAAARQHNHGQPGAGVEVRPEGWVRCGKDGHREARFYAVRFEGVLEVADPVQLRQTLTEGIGTAKGFGFGLLSLARAED